MGNKNLISGAAQQVGNVDFVVVPIFSIAASVAVVLHYKSTIRVFFAQSSPGGEAQCLRAKRTPKQLNREKRKKKKKRRRQRGEHHFGGAVFVCVWRGGYAICGEYRAICCERRTNTVLSLPFCRNAPRR